MKIAIEILKLLIASAPDLAKAVQNAVYQWGKDNKRMGQASNLLTRVRARTHEREIDAAIDKKVNRLTLTREERKAHSAKAKAERVSRSEEARSDRESVQAEAERKIDKPLEL